jgi:nitroimidazol reductase NimA-like FMN-containing flavoprotein (pyridoxamine 5'-phosphate oxidase superfamily)
MPALGSKTARSRQNPRLADQWLCGASLAGNCGECLERAHKYLIFTLLFRPLKTRRHQGRDWSMDEEIRKKILTILDEHRTMTIATLRPDGWPQATTVVYANQDFTIYFVCGPESQKAANLARDDRVSLTIDHETPDVTEITGLSMAAHAQSVVDLAEASKALRMLRLRYPLLPIPMPEDVRIFRITPTIISVIDYSKGFGHTDLITC